MKTHHHIHEIHMQMPTLPSVSDKIYVSKYGSRWFGGQVTERMKKQNNSGHAHALYILKVIKVTMMQTGGLGCVVLSSDM